MEIRNCEKCGKIYRYDGSKICMDCRREEENEFLRVKEYIYDNPGSTIQLVSEETEVSTKKIFRYLREGKLEIKDNNNNLVLDCERCGKPIKSGRFCEKCTIELERELKGAVASSHGHETKDIKANKMQIRGKQRSR